MACEPQTLLYSIYKTVGGITNNVIDTDKFANQIDSVKYAAEHYPLATIVTTVALSFFAIWAINYMSAMIPVVCVKRGLQQVLTIATGATVTWILFEAYNQAAQHGTLIRTTCPPAQQIQPNSSSSSSQSV